MGEGACIHSGNCTRMDANVQDEGHTARRRRFGRALFHWQARAQHSPLCSGEGVATRMRATEQRQGACRPGRHGNAASTAMDRRGEKSRGVGVTLMANHSNRRSMQSVQGRSVTPIPRNSEREDRDRVGSQLDPLLRYASTTAGDGNLSQKDAANGIFGSSCQQLRSAS